MKRYLKLFIFLLVLVLVLVLVPLKAKAKTRTDFNLESPSYNSIVNKELKIGGWLMTESNNPIFHIYIDNEEVNTTINRVKRTDVNRTFPNYSNNSNNQKPGFNTNIDLTNYKAGKHILTINILDHEQNEVLKESSTVFYIEKYKTDFNLESPSSNSIVNKELKIGGWLMTESNNPIFHIYIDNEEVNTTINRVKRTDVNRTFPNYSNNSNNQKPGFNTNIDLTNYKAGKHILTINILDHEQNEVLKESSIVFYIEKYKTDFNLESPNNNSVVEKELKISGWLMTESNNPIFHIYIDNEEVNTTINRVKRTDVNRTFPNYSNNSNNQKPGFNTTIDTSTYLDGKHTLTLKIMDSEQNEIIKEYSREFSIEKYKTIFNIESPKNNAKYSKNMTVGGWLMSTKKDAKIEYYINDEIINANIVRNKRPDVISAVSGYGGISTNPTPGFNATLDLSSYKDGNYKLEVRIVDDITKEVLKKDYRNIILKKYDGCMNIESPQSNEELGTKLKVSGWILSEYKDSKIEIYLDNQLIENEINRIARPDVINTISGYGGISTNPTPGFNTSIDISDIDDGAHNLKVRIVNPTTNEEIVSSSKKININKNKTIINLESPKSSQKRNIKIGGWFLSLNTNNYLKVFIDDQEIECEIKRIKRQDVISVVKGYGDEEINPTPGFNTTVDLKDYKDGKHTVTVKVFEKRKNQIIGESSTQIDLKKYEGILNIETPQINTEVNRNMKIGGWALSTDKDDSVRVLIDDEIKQTSVSRSTRKDVTNVVTGYGDEEINPTPGFNTTVDLTSYKDGKHTVTVQIIDNNTFDVIAQNSTSFKLKKYNGEINIEIPQTSMLNSSSLVIAGWEMSELDNSYVEIYIDDVKRNASISRFERADVISSVTNYGTINENATPGFNTTIDISDLPAGKHTIKIKLYSKLNEFITEKSKTIIKYNDVYFGIDVSYYNGTIDWNAVKQDGISFAFIRTGYRGYGTGRMVEDDKFKENITNAIANNVSSGVYFYTQAINENEAISEADFTVGKLQEYGMLEKLKLPIVIDTEFTDVGIGRADGLSQAQRTKVVKAFCDRIRQHGYTPMIYASRDFLYFNLHMSELSNYDVWLAHYTSTDDPLNHQSNYTGAYKIWQYTSNGTVRGINGRVDKNISYVKY